MKVLLSLVCVCLFFNLSANEPSFTYFKVNLNNKNQGSGHFDKIEEALTEDFEKICQEKFESKVAEILNWDYLFELGAKNQIGFDFSVSLGFIKVKVERELYPDLSSTGGWIVEDTIGVKINGAELLTELAQDNTVTIPEDNIGLFANLYYRRVYKYQHRAATYKQALLSNYRYITHSYKKFINSNYTSLLPGELISKADSIGTAIAGKLSYESPYFIEIINKASIAFTHLNEVIIQKPTNRLNTQMFLTYVRSKTKNTNAEISVGNDFINLVYLTLINLEYSHINVNETARVFEFDKEAIDAIENQEDLAFEINDLIKYRNISENLIAKYQKSQEEASLIQEKGRWLFLMWGKSGLSEKQYFDLNNFGEDRKYFSRKVNAYTSFSRTPLSMITIGSDKIKYDAFKNRETKVEYATDENKNPILIPVDDSEPTPQMLARASVNVRVKKDSFTSKKYQRLIIQILNNYQKEGLEIVENIESEQLVAPFEVMFNNSVTNSGLDYIINLAGSYSGALAQLCRIKDVDNMSPVEQSCYSSLKKGLVQLYANYDENNGKISPEYIKNILLTLNKYVQGPNDYKILFGDNGIFTSGFFKSKTKEGPAFQIYLNDEGIEPVSLIEPYLYKY